MERGDLKGIAPPRILIIFYISYHALNNIILHIA